MGVLIAVGLAAAGVLLLLVMRAAPRFAFAVWCATLTGVPVWIGVSVGPFWSAITVMTLAAVIAYGKDVTLRPVDGAAAVLVLLLIALFGLRLISLAALVIALSEWVLPYVWGRLVLGRLAQPTFVDVVATFTVIAAALGVAEFVTGVNPFTRITAPGSASLYAIWGPLQERGGRLRVEGAFGHSIAFGATLAMGSAFVLAARWPAWVRLVGLALVTVAVGLTLSRVALLTLVLTVGLGLVLLPGLGRRLRVGVVAGGVLAAGVLAPTLGRVFLAAGDEASGSAGYRLDLMSLLPLVRPFGASDDIAGLTAAGTYVGDFARSIDNAVLVAALRVGWVPTALLLLLVGVAVAEVVRRAGRTPAAIAVACQIPSMFVVAFITQFAVAFWFCVGVALSARSAGEPQQSPPRTDGTGQTRTEQMAGRAT